MAEKTKIRAKMVIEKIYTPNPIDYDDGEELPTIEQMVEWDKKEIGDNPDEFLNLFLDDAEVTITLEAIE